MALPRPNNHSAFVGFDESNLLSPEKKHEAAGAMSVGQTQDCHAARRSGASAGSASGLRMARGTLTRLTSV
jgi:hypothetical protein